MMRRDTSPSSRRLKALHTPSPTSAAMKMRKLSRSLLRRFILLTPARVGPFQRHDLHRRVAHFVQEAVDDRAAQQNVPTRTRRLAEHHVSDALAPGEIDQRVGDVGALQFYYLRAEFLSETQALRERDVILRVDRSEERRVGQECR